jgi:hypothetical protein
MRPVWCSMLLPGIGQWMQHRRNAGTFYLMAFIVLGSFVVAVLIRAFMDGSTLPRGPLGVLAFIYGAGVVDTIRGREQLRKKASTTASS